MSRYTGFASVQMYGDALINPLVNGSYTGNYLVPNVTQFGYQPNSTQDTIPGTNIDNYNQSLDPLNQSGDHAIQMAFNRPNDDSMAIAASGTRTANSTTTAAITDEVVGLAKESATGQKVGHLSKFDVSATTVVIQGYDLTVADSTGFAANTVLTNSTTGKTLGVITSVPDGTSILFLRSTTNAVSNGDTITDGTNSTTVGSTPSAANSIAVLTTDFTEDTTNGRITVVGTSTVLTLSNIEAVVVNYTHTELGGSLIQIANQSQITAKLTIKGINAVTTKRIWVQYESVRFAQNALVELMTQGSRATPTLNGVANTPSGSTYPGVLILGD